MRRIMVVNPKGGCGKTTLATNLAGAYASQGARVVLADYDPQASSLAWLSARPSDRARIAGVPAVPGKELKLPRGCEVLVIDAPAGITGKPLKQLARTAQTVLVPVLPSPIDIRAAARFLQELLTLGRVTKDRLRVGVVANRVRTRTLIYQTLYHFLRSLDVPFVTSLRDTQNYIRAADRGLSITEMAPFMVAYDRVQWEPLFNWLDSAASLPRPKKG
ncbi:MAG: chromosome partitioning protein [Gammaproteobacteria bacterium]|nr:MAG: chromosome partitioning protein [Gammaproteobacteria bacterium]